LPLQSARRGNPLWLPLLMLAKWYQDWSDPALVTSWLEDLVISKVSLEIPPFQWFKESWLYNAIKNGFVVTKAVV